MTTKHWTCLAAAASLSLGLAISAGNACDQDAKAAAAHETKPVASAAEKGCDKPCCAKAEGAVAAKATGASAPATAVAAAKTAESPCAAAKASDAPCAAKSADGKGCPKKAAAQIADTKPEAAQETAKTESAAGPGTNR